MSPNFLSLFPSTTGPVIAYSGEKRRQYSTCGIMYSKSGCVKAKDVESKNSKNKAQVPRDKRLPKQRHNDLYSRHDEGG